MERGKISIENNTVHVKLHEETVWLTQHQIADLFGVFIAAVNSNIRTILKSEVLDTDKVCRNLNHEKGITVLYNLEMITALAFRVKSENAEIFRHWMITKRSQSTMILWHNPDMRILMN